MSLERRNLQNLIHKFEISGKWPMNQYSKTLAQTVIDSEWMKRHDQEVRENEKRRLVQDGYSQGEPRYCKEARDRYINLVAELKSIIDSVDETIAAGGNNFVSVHQLRDLVSGDYLLK